ncbi:OmpA family protein [Spirosoma sp. SC4-14]|uniref:OmpA family protein n=1 Tax=Spirosoma sp. SC4-14 TaxID=3128900 RepID=UPI0030D27F59
MSRPGLSAHFTRSILVVALIGSHSLAALTFGRTCSEPKRFTRSDTIPRANALAIVIRVVDAETGNVVSMAQVSAVDEQTQQTIESHFDRAAIQHTILALPGTSLTVRATAQDYLITKVRLPDLRSARQITMKLLKSKPSVLTIKVFSEKIDQPLNSAVVTITSRMNGQTAHFSLTNGILVRAFTESDELTIRVSAAGHKPVDRQLVVEVLPSGKVYEFDVELDKITASTNLRAVDSLTGKPIADARFTLLATSGIKPEAMMFFAVKGVTTVQLAAGERYQFTVDARNYKEAIGTLSTENGKGDITIRLKPIKSLVDTKEVTATKPNVTPASSLPTSIGSLSAVTTKSFGRVEKGKAIRLNRIYFDQSSPVLRSESYAELNQLADLLMQSPSIRIEIRGHTDNQGDFDLNTKLSRDRCQAVIDYLTERGIQRNRLKAIGRGPLDPVAPNNNEENRKKNRRVEFVVL